MRVIPQSFEILSDLDNDSMAARIESCGRICYKSEDKISDTSAEPFIEKILKHGHNSVAEMAVLTIKIVCIDPNDIAAFYQIVPRYFSIDQQENSLMITGSVRAFRELYKFNPQIKMVKGITSFLAKQYPLFFFDFDPEEGWQDAEGITIEKIPLADVDQLPPEQLARHRHLAVKLITNRAVTHEIVRHRPCSFLQESQRYCRYDKEQFGNEVTFIKPMFFKNDSPEYKIWEKAMADTESLYLKLLETSSPQAARTVLPNSCKTEIIIYANLTEWYHIFNLRTSKGAEPSMREIMNPLLVKFKEIFPSVYESL